MVRKRPPPRIEIDFGEDESTGDTYVNVRAHPGLDIYQAPWLDLLDEHQRAAGTISRFVVALMTGHPWTIGQIYSDLEAFHHDSGSAPGITIDMPDRVTDPADWKATVIATLQEILTADATAARWTPGAA